MPSNQAEEINKIKHNDYSKLEQNFNYDISIQESTSFREGNSDVFVIKGIAINSTTTKNGHTFLSEELEKSASGLRGKPLLKDHTNTIDSIIGKVTDAFYDSVTRSIKFEAKIFDKSIQEKIREGLINKVSVGAYTQSVEEADDDTYILRGIEFVELSLVAVPADAGAEFAMAVMQSLQKESTKVSKNKVSAESTQNKIKMEDKKVEDKIEESKQESVKESQDFSELKLMMESLVESNKALKETVSELKAKKQVEEKVEEKKVEEKVDETKGSIARESVDDEEVEESAQDFVLERAGSGFAFYRNSYGDSKILSRGNK